MALGNNNPLTSKVTGMLGQSMVFKQYDGKTVITAKPAPSSKPPSSGQIRCRCTFKVASVMARQLLTDPAELERFKAIARTRKSNALTQARRAILKLIYANPSDFEEIIAEEIANYTPPVPSPKAGKKTTAHAAGQPDTFETLLASAGNITPPAGNTNQITQQLSEMTHALNNCLQEIQKTMAKATEMLNAITALNSTANAATSNTHVVDEQLVPADHEHNPVQHTAITNDLCIPETIQINEGAYDEQPASVEDVCNHDQHINTTSHLCAWEHLYDVTDIVDEQLASADDLLNHNQYIERPEPLCAREHVHNNTDVTDEQWATGHVVRNHDQRVNTSDSLHAPEHVYNAARIPDEQPFVVTTDTLIRDHAYAHGYTHDDNTLVTVPRRGRQPPT